MSGRFIIASVLLALVACSTVQAARDPRILLDVTAPRPAAAPYVNPNPECTPGHPLVSQALGGLNGHGMHQSLTCAPGQIVTSITLGSSASVPPVLSSIQIDCSNTSFTAAVYPTARNITVRAANGTANFTTLTSSDGFNAASVITSNSSNPNSSLNLGWQINPILQLTVSTPSGQSVSAGSPGSITGDVTSSAAFSLPSNARINGFGIFYQTYINGLSLVAICPDLAPASAPVVSTLG